ncbi:MAG: hypothetical protein IPQ07_36135 [Myxococcales bacterium]|nr:hypothetical protein [Myxococcales bacterium]
MAEAKSQNAEIEKLKKRTAEDKYLALDPCSVAEAVDSREGPLRRHQYEFGPRRWATLTIGAGGEERNTVAAYRAASVTSLVKHLSEAKTEWAEVYDLARRGGISNKLEPPGAGESRTPEFPGKSRRCSRRSSREGGSMKAHAQALKPLSR